MDKTKRKKEMEHKQRHIQLHCMLDELVADYITHTDKMPSKSSVYELMEWSYQQTINPCEND